jgi:pyruvate dehydrogenase E1 component beta subunit
MPDDAGAQPLGKARVARAGRDLTVVTYGATVHTALLAAAALAGEGIELEILDLRTLQPWDEPAVLESLRRTHRLVVAHEAVEAFGAGAEIAARMADVGFDELDAPIVRVGAPFMPVPFARSLEQRYIPGADAIVAAARRAMA